MTVNSCCYLLSGFPQWVKRSAWQEGSSGGPESLIKECTVKDMDTDIDTMDTDIDTRYRYRCRCRYRD